MPLDHLRTFAAHSAALELCLSPELVAHALSLSLADARKALTEAAAAGLYRRILLPYRRGVQGYQPTPKGAGLRVCSGAAARTPRFLRSGLPPSVVERAMLRAYVALVAHPAARYFSVYEQASLCRDHAVPLRGHSRALMSSDWRIYVPVLASEHPIQTVTTAAARWLPAFESVDGGLHALSYSLNFVTAPGTAADAFRAALDSLKGPNLTADLAGLDERIARDRTGVLAIRHAAERAALAAAAASSRGQLPWLGEVIEVSC
jgi:uncharacterized membrane protein